MVTEEDAQQAHDKKGASLSARVWRQLPGSDI